MVLWLCFAQTPLTLAIQAALFFLMWLIVAWLLGVALLFCVVLVVVALPVFAAMLFYIWIIHAFLFFTVGVVYWTVKFVQAAPHAPARICNAIMDLVHAIWSSFDSLLRSRFCRFGWQTSARLCRDIRWVAVGGNRVVTGRQIIEGRHDGVRQCLQRPLPEVLVKIVLSYCKHCF